MEMGVRIPDTASGAPRARESRIIRAIGLMATCLGLGLAACSGEQGATTGFEVTDSTGIEIVFSSAPVWSDGDGWTVGEDPIIEIGSIDGDEPYLLTRVRGVARLEDGRIVVADQGDNTIRFYDAAGRYIMRTGGSGDGPGEFSFVWELFRTPGVLHGTQSGARPINRYDAESGYFLGAIRPTDPSAFVHGIFRDGSALVAPTPQGFPVRPGVYTVNSTFVRIAPTGDTTTVDTYPTSSFVGIGSRAPIWQEYAPSLQIFVHGMHFYHAYPSEYVISVRDTAGALVRSIRRAWDPIPVSEADKAAYREPLLNPDIPPGRSIPAVALQQWRELAEGMVFPEHHPAYANIFIDRVENLWVRRVDPSRGIRRNSPPSTDGPEWWDVFDPAGAWLGGVALPANLTVFEVGDGYVAGVWRNDLDVEFVQVRELTKIRP